MNDADRRVFNDVDLNFHSLIKYLALCGKYNVEALNVENICNWKENRDDISKKLVVNLLLLTFIPPMWKL